MKYNHISLLAILSYAYFFVKSCFFNDNTNLRKLFDFFLYFKYNKYRKQGATKCGTIKNRIKESLL